MDTLLAPAPTEVSLESGAELLPAQVLEPESEVFRPRVLDQMEETFALAMVEFAGNISAAYKAVYGSESQFPLARGRELLQDPSIAMRIKDLGDSMEEGILISKTAHLDALARIRDLAIVTGNVKTALNAEMARGDVAGLYIKRQEGNNKGSNNVQINVVMASKHDENI